VRRNKANLGPWFCQRIAGAEDSGHRKTQFYALLGKTHPRDSEPVSGRNSLLTGNLQGILRQSGPFWRKIACKNAAKSVSCRTIPYKMKQGINSRQTGNLLSRAGNLQRLAGSCPPCAGISPDLSRTWREVVAAAASMKGLWKRDGRRKFPYCAQKRGVRYLMGWTLPPAG
jgi:hypothetical protein